MLLLIMMLFAPSPPADVSVEPTVNAAVAQQAVKYYCMRQYNVGGKIHSSKNVSAGDEGVNQCAVACNALRQECSGFGVSANKCFLMKAFNTSSSAADSTLDALCMKSANDWLDFGMQTCKCDEGRSLLMGGGRGGRAVCIVIISTTNDASGLSAYVQHSGVQHARFMAVARSAICCFAYSVSPAPSQTAAAKAAMQGPLTTLLTISLNRACLLCLPGCLLLQPPTRSALATFACAGMTSRVTQPAQATWRTLCRPPTQSCQA